MKHLTALLFVVFTLCCVTMGAQNVTRTRHQAALTTDAVTTGTLTIRKPDYICISTDGGRDQLLMDGTKFTMTMGGKMHETDSQQNPQFDTFQKVLHAVINAQPIPECEDLTVETKNGQRTITITPSTKKKRQMFTSFVLVIDEKTSAFRQLRMNERADNYINYDFK
ncbi:MAG: outer membrane lipoprotein carrier protein LolA [Bacteroidaceae bacterium]|nr:outer membrane lipoprotein carrier protein LolA [Bacteroidaceae bacterium]